MIKTFIGFDLGNSDSIIDCVTLSTASLKSGLGVIFRAMMMPGTHEPGRPIPTEYAYTSDNRLILGNAILHFPGPLDSIQRNFLHRPTDLISEMGTEKEADLLECFSASKMWPNRADCNTQEFWNYRNAVITFTNAIFEDSTIKEAIQNESVESDEIVIYVGYPVGWSELDTTIYKRILEYSVIGAGNYAGHKATLNLALDTKAAYHYYTKCTAECTSGQNLGTMLIDIGGVCVKSEAFNSCRRQYLGTNKYLGGDSIDLLLLDLYLEKLAQYPEYFESYQQFAQKSPFVNDVARLAAKRTKEDLYSGLYSFTFTDVSLAIMCLGQLRPIRIMADELEQLIQQKPLAEVLQKYVHLPEAELQKIGTKSWEKLFEEYLQQIADACTISVDNIFITGGLSGMPAVSRIIKKVFNNLPTTSFKRSMNSTQVSRGLASLAVDEERWSYK